MCLNLPGLTAAASVADTEIHKKILQTTTETLEQQHLIFNEQLENYCENS